MNIVATKPNPQSTLAPLNIFYIFSFYIFLSNANIFRQMLLPPDSDLWIFFLKFLAPVPREMIQTGTGLLLGASSLWACLSWKKNRAPRALFFFSFLFFDAILNSGFKINNGNTAWLFVSFVAIFCPKFNGTEDLTEESTSDSDALFLLRATLLITYFQSGFWKLKYFVRSPEEILNTARFANLIAYRWLTAGSEPSAFATVFLQNPIFLQVGYVLVILLQLSGPFLLFTGRFNTFLGLAFCGFHLLNDLLMTIRFSLQAILCVILFLSPAMFRVGKKRVG